MTSKLRKNLDNRDKLVDGLHEEMIGPTKDFSNAKLLTEETVCSDEKNSFYYWNFDNKKEEVFIGQPQRQYNSGILYPLDVAVSDEEIQESTELEERNSTFHSENMESEEDTEDEVAEEDVKRIENPYLPSSMGITFAVLPEEKSISIKFSCGGYDNRLINKSIQIKNSKNWWFRKSLEKIVSFDLATEHSKQQFNLIDSRGQIFHELQLRLDATVRKITLPATSQQLKIITITATNITSVIDIKETQNIMFQCQLTADGLQSGFQPYPSAESLEADIEDEDKKFDLLYSKESNYGFGQTCATTWKTNLNGTVTTISSTFLPEYEIKTMTPDIVIEGNKVELSPAKLAGVRNIEELRQEFEPLISGYKNWLDNIKMTTISKYYQKVYDENIKAIEECVQRIECGLNILAESQTAFDIFRLTNLAMLMQMTNGKEKRELMSDGKAISFDKPFNDVFAELDYSTVDTLAASVRKITSTAKANEPWIAYKWRAFQIAFLLMSIESIVNKDSKNRKMADLLWFPTGGGKTEAYLGVIAFSMMYRRVINPMDSGTDVIMRYTLRLLTTDQFQRAARLVCSLEYLRQHLGNKMGETEFSLGMWVGGTTTPNTVDQAKTRYAHILKGKATIFPITSCPWCGAGMVVKDENYYGYRFERGIIVHCPDKDCQFHNRIPIYFVDEQLYDVQPTFLIGTIDKFVQLTWKPEARAFFGIDKNGERQFTPPNIIIQDELHLISGPLGTLTGMYECLIDELCTDYRKTEPVKVKIICATATIKAFQSQIKALFNRSQTALFPPSGIDIDDNFFSTVETDEAGQAKPGRKYIGIHPFTQGRLQTEVQTTSRLMETVASFPEDDRDPFWTILSFYNTINDIGRGISLTQQDIPSYIKEFYKRHNINENKRFISPDKVKELTSRLDSGKVGAAIDEMKEPYKITDNRALDLVLASNIIEVGIDIDRLSLMTINGQPKSTAQYIQVSGRVGRRTWDRPGLIVTEYNPNNSNDKSHYEHFIEYHQRLYGQVEESSVTPFSRFAIERGLPAVIVGYLRQSFNLKTLGTAPDDEEIETNKNRINRFLSGIKNRAEGIDNTEIDFLMSTARSVLKDLVDNDYGAWEYKSGKNEIMGFMVPMTKNREDIPENVRPIIFSMRSVDKTSKLKVTSLEIVESDDFF